MRLEKNPVQSGYRLLKNKKENESKNWCYKGIDKLAGVDE